VQDEQLPANSIAPGILFAAGLGSVGLKLLHSLFKPVGQNLVNLFDNTGASLA
jgi:hypothetical protein